MQAWLDALLALDRGWRRYTHDTQRSDAGAIVYEAAEGWGGASLALFIKGGLDLARPCKRRAVEESGLALTRPMGDQARRRPLRLGSGLPATVNAAGVFLRRVTALGDLGAGVKRHRRPPCRARIRRRGRLLVTAPAMPRHR